MNDILTIVCSNRDRLSVDNIATKLWIRSIKNQTVKNFRVIVSDGGSKNYGEISKLLSDNISCVQHVLGEKFHRNLLNNVGVRAAKTPYIMTSDVDMFYGPDFVKTIIENLNPTTWVQSRTMYWKGDIVHKINNGEIDPSKDINACRIGRIKKRTTAGGCQCGHIDIWNKVRGYDERYIGWGSEDVDLVRRVSMANFRVRWLGETLDSIMLFHQPHRKINYKQDLKDQYSNLRYYQNIRRHDANPEGWGGIKDIAK